MIEVFKALKAHIEEQQAGDSMIIPAATTEQLREMLVVYGNQHPCYLAAKELLTAREAQPFLFAICNPDGSAWLDENCVADTEKNLKPVLNDLRRDTGDAYRIIPLFAAPPVPVTTPAELSRAIERVSHAWTLSPGQIKRLYDDIQHEIERQKTPPPVSGPLRSEDFSKLLFDEPTSLPKPRGKA